MRNVMRKGEVGGLVRLDTISDRRGLYGVGPVAYLRGELLINNGVAYRSVVTPDATMAVERTYAVEAPFFVYGNVTDWKAYDLPTDVRTLPELEAYLEEMVAAVDRPFVLRLTGRAAAAVVHVQNLPPGSRVSSPAEAHRGQVSYPLTDREVTVVGFYSRKHRTIFTHHDSYVHFHLITTDETAMGHLDELTVGEMQLWLPRGLLD